MPRNEQLALPGFDDWQAAYDKQLPDGKTVRNRSGIEVQPMYTPADWDGNQYEDKLGYPGTAPFTRGIYPTMHRGRTWSQRQLIGLGIPKQYNERLHRMLKAGTSAISMIPCNSIYRGLDADQCDPLILGTCGTIINTVDDMETCLDGIPIDEISTALNDPLPFTMLAQVLTVAERRQIPWTKISGTANQSDYISHFVANHMFYRLALPGSRRVLLDHIEFAREKVPNWNPMSVVGQHMQQAGATPAEAMAFTLSTAIQNTEDCLSRGMDLEDVLTRFTFFFDISVSFFEEVAKFRAGRRIWARIVRDRFGISSEKAQRFKFHGQTSGVDLTRQQPLNNIARVTAQAIAGIFGGLQSLHTDSFDEVLSTPTEDAARIAIATQNILREEAHLTDVIDPLGGSYYIERLTDQMEEEIVALMEKIDDLGGMYKAVESGWVQGKIGASAMAFQDRITHGDETIVGVNAYQVDSEVELPVKPLDRPAPEDIEAFIENLAKYKRNRDQDAVDRALDDLGDIANDNKRNTFEGVVNASRAGATQSETIAVLRAELGFGQPLVVA
ncbi:MAG: methylmalonyl-CoA mutase [Alphaproteobacteria bacterium]|jgi:methylmalonyl-CoA mutase, N-terminal domain|nr:methylmalonyl-CoA mutase [Alphaproteobacteria bacterium]MBT4019334.1 methylmalonyl-CoA mutase [Alphaproteobacteria bacterium]MBT4966699.1 methylmalonyl-CoA mutase [Alphaproteobacteria bacterium]MBT5161936.1 methylmalonyl-CoA mutase [Alphaproteobacteria bacterium]MBT5916934.1 methylmalonyl-CoA mutase [Alphaproteobacteria bacterium]